MPISLQKSGLTGRLIGLAGPQRSLYDRNPRKEAELAAEIPDVTTDLPDVPAQEPPNVDVQRNYRDYASPMAEREPLDPMGFEEAQPTPLGYQDTFAGRLARDFENPTTALSYGYGLALGGPMGLGLAALKHVGTRALKDYAVPFLKQAFTPESKAEQDPSGIDSALGGTGNVDPSKGIGFDMTSSNMPGSFGEGDPTGVSTIGKGVGNLGYGPTDIGYGFDMASANEPGGEKGGFGAGGEFGGADNDDGGWW